MMSANNTGTGSLQRAHALSAQASQLLHAPSPPLATLVSALESYRLAAELFDSAAQAAASETSPAPGAAGTNGATGKTLQLLVAQHKKLVRDLERRIAAATTGDAGGAAMHHPGVRRAATVPAPSSSSSRSDGATGSITRIGATSPIKRPTELPGLAAAVTVAAQTGSPFVTSGARVLPAASATARGIPPFALRPPVIPPPGAGAAASAVDPFRSSASVASSSRAPGAGAGALAGQSTAGGSSAAAGYNHTLSPLYSSTSTTSSDPDPAESYVTFTQGHRGGPVPGASTTGRHTGVAQGDVDPFSRFWGMLEDCLDQVSRPIAFASAPLGGPPSANEEPGEADLEEGLEGAGRAGQRGGALKERREGRTVKGEQVPRGKENRSKRNGSPSESYYMIPPDITRPPQNRPAIPERQRSTSSSNKTPEELALENASLRASLDALALHAQQVQEENRGLKLRSRERDEQLRNVAAGVRKEAEKARLDTSILRSQVLSLPSHPALQSPSAATTTPTPTSGRRPTTSPEMDQTGDGESKLVSSLRHRIQELEDQVKSLSVEGEKQKAHLSKYKDRFDKIKATARAKKDAKNGTTGLSMADA